MASTVAPVGAVRAVPRRGAHDSRDLIPRRVALPRRRHLLVLLLVLLAAWFPAPARGVDTFTTLTAAWSGSAGCSAAEPTFTFQTDKADGNAYEFGVGAGTPAAFRLTVPGWWSEKDIGYSDGVNKATLDGTTKLDVLFFHSYKESASGDCADVAGWLQECTEINSAIADCQVAARYVRGDASTAGGTGGNGVPANPATSRKGCYVDAADGKVYMNTDGGAAIIAGKPALCDCRNSYDPATCRIQKPTGFTAGTAACCPPGEVCVFSDPAMAPKVDVDGSASVHTLVLSPSLGLRLPAVLAANSPDLKMSIVPAANIASPTVTEKAFTASPAVAQLELVMTFVDTALGETSATVAATGLKTTSFTISESAETAVKFKLTGQAPYGNVGISIGGGIAMVPDDRLQVAPSNLVFTPANWNVDQTVAFRGFKNLIQDGDVTLTLALVPTRSTAEDACFAYASAANTRGNVAKQSFAVKVADDDKAGIQLVKTVADDYDPSLIFELPEQGAPGSVKVNLRSQPTADVTVTIKATAGTTVQADALVANGGCPAMTQPPTAGNTATLTFTKTTWQTQQLVCVQGMLGGASRVTAYPVAFTSASTDAYYATHEVQTVGIEATATKRTDGVTAFCRIEDGLTGAVLDTTTSKAVDNRWQRQVGIGMWKCEPHNDTSPTELWKGTFQLGVKKTAAADPVYTAPISYSASAAEVKTALEALAVVGVVSVTRTTTGVEVPYEANVTQVRRGENCSVSNYTWVDAGAGATTPIVSYKDPTWGIWPSAGDPTPTTMCATSPAICDGPYPDYLRGATPSAMAARAASMRAWGLGGNDNYNYTDCQYYNRTVYEYGGLRGVTTDDYFGFARSAVVKYAWAIEFTGNTFNMGDADATALVGWADVQPMSVKSDKLVGFKAVGAPVETTKGSPVFYPHSILKALVISKSMTVKMAVIAATDGGRAAGYGSGDQLVMTFGEETNIPGILAQASLATKTCQFEVPQTACMYTKTQVDAMFTFTDNSSPASRKAVLGADYGASWEWKLMPGGAKAEVGYMYTRHNYQHIDTCGGFVEPVGRKAALPANIQARTGTNCVDLRSELKRGDIIRIDKESGHSEVRTVRGFGTFDKYQLPITPVFKDPDQVANCPGTIYDPGCANILRVTIYKLSRKTLVLTIFDAAGHSRQDDYFMINSAGKTALKITMKAAGGFKDRYSVSDASTQASLLTGGTWGNRTYNFTASASNGGNQPGMGAGDNITCIFTFEVNTKVFGPVLLKADIDGLFSMSGALGKDYRGTWRNLRTLDIVLFDIDGAAGSGQTRVGLMSLTTKPNSKLMAWDNSTMPAWREAVLGGSWGSRSGPQFYLNASNSGVAGGFNVGDSLIVTFDTVVNVPVMGNKAGVDAVLNFMTAQKSTPINMGAAYSGAWAEKIVTAPNGNKTKVSVLTVTFTDLTGADDSSFTRLGTLAVRVRPSSGLKTADLTAVVDAQATLQGGSWGALTSAPMVSVVMSVNADNQPGLGAGDAVTVTFNMATSQPYKAQLGAWTTVSKRRRASSVSGVAAVLVPESQRRRLASWPACGWGQCGVTCPALYTCASHAPLCKADVDAIVAFSVPGGTVSPFAAATYIGCWVSTNSLQVTITSCGPMGASAAAENESCDALSQNTAVGTLQATTTVPTSAGTPNPLQSADGSSPLVKVGDAVAAPAVATANPDPANNAGAKRPTPVMTLFQAGENQNASTPGISVGDFFLVTFDQFMDQVDISTKAKIDALFVFSTSIGGYVGSWDVKQGSDFSAPYPSKTARIVLTDVTGVDRVATSLGTLTVGLAVGSALTSADKSSDPVAAGSLVKLTGSYGDNPAPKIIVAQAMNTGGHPGLNSGDQLVLRFDQETNRARGEGDKAEVDALLYFSSPLGKDYSGSWLDSKTYIVLIKDATNGVLPFCPEHTPVYVDRTGPFQRDEFGKKTGQIDRAQFVKSQLFSTSSDVDGMAPPGRDKTKLCGFNMTVATDVSLRTVADALPRNTTSRSYVILDDIMWTGGYPGVIPMEDGRQGSPAALRNFLNRTVELNLTMTLTPTNYYKNAGTKENPDLEVLDTKGWKFKSVVPGGCTVKNSDSRNMTGMMKYNLPAVEPFPQSHGLGGSTKARNRMKLAICSSRTFNISGSFAVTDKNWQLWTEVLLPMGTHPDYPYTPLSTPMDTRVGGLVISVRRQAFLLSSDRSSAPADGTSRRQNCPGEVSNLLPGEECPKVLGPSFSTLYSGSWGDLPMPSLIKGSRDYPIGTMGPMIYLPESGAVAIDYGNQEGLGNGDSIMLYFKEPTNQVAATAVQSITISADTSGTEINPVDGYFTIKFRTCEAQAQVVNSDQAFPDCTTDNLPVDATSQQVLEALELLKTIGPGGIIQVTREPIKGKEALMSFRWQVTFSARLARLAVGKVELLELRTAFVRYVDKNVSVAAIVEPFTGATLPSRQDVDALFIFSYPIGDDYSAVWLDPKRLEIKIKDTRILSRKVTFRDGSRVQGGDKGKLSITIKPNVVQEIISTELGDQPLYVKTDDGRLIQNLQYQLKSADLASRPAEGTYLVKGSWGTMQPPSIKQALARDTEKQGRGMSENDILRITFDAETSMPPVGTKAQVDLVFDFRLWFGCCTEGPICAAGLPDCKAYPYQNSVFLGKNYTGRWLDAMRLDITISDADVTPSATEQSGASKVGMTLTDAFSKMDLEKWKIVVLLKGKGNPLRSADFSSTFPVTLNGCYFDRTTGLMAGNEFCPQHLCHGNENAALGEAAHVCNKGSEKLHGVPIIGSWGPEDVPWGLKGIVQVGSFASVVLVFFVFVAVGFKRACAVAEGAHKEMKE